MRVKHIIEITEDELPERRVSPVSPYVQNLAIFAAYPFTTGSGAAARKRPGNGRPTNAPRSRGRFVRESA